MEENFNKNLPLPTSNLSEIADFCGVSPRVFKQWIRPLVINLQGFQLTGRYLNKVTCIKRIIHPVDMSRIFDYLGLSRSGFLVFHNLNQRKPSYERISFNDLADKAHVCPKTYRKIISELAIDAGLSLKDLLKDNPSRYLYPGQVEKICKLYGSDQEN
jgi:hypothetical protein